MKKMKAIQSFMRFSMQNCCIIILMLFCFFLSSQVEGALQFEKTEIKVAVKLTDTNVSVVFKLKNIGTTPVLIKKVETSCGCTSASCDKQIYLPGEIGNVSATVELGSFHGEMLKTLGKSNRDSPRFHGMTRRRR